MRGVLMLTRSFLWVGRKYLSFVNKVAFNIAS